MVNRISVVMEPEATSHTKADEFILAGVPAQPPTVPISSSTRLCFPHTPGSLRLPWWGVLWITDSSTPAFEKAQNSLIYFQILTKAISSMWPMENGIKGEVAELRQEGWGRLPDAAGSTGTACCKH